MTLNLTETKDADEELNPVYEIQGPDNETVDIQPLTLNLTTTTDAPKELLADALNATSSLFQIFDEETSSSFLNFAMLAAIFLIGFFGGILAFRMFKKEEKVDQDLTERLLVPETYSRV